MGFRGYPGFTGPQGIKGESYTRNLNLNHLSFRPSAPTWFCGNFCVPGQKGDLGDKGAPGPVGFTGMKGQRGFKGLMRSLWVQGHWLRFGQCKFC